MSEPLRRTRRAATLLIGLVLCGALLAGCGADPLSRVGPGDLTYGGISISVPDGWYGRILTAPQGEGAAIGILEVANFDMGPQSGSEPPKELPPGQEDPIKAMAGDDLLITIQTPAASSSARSLPVRFARSSLVTVDSISLPVPNGHAVVHEAGCFTGRCLDVTVDLASHPVSDRLLDTANQVLSSLKVNARSN
jgi:hypothetical protein